jgi:hypothetical protein
MYFVLTHKMKYVNIIITKGAQPKRLALKMCSSCPVRFRGQTGQLFYLLKKLLFLLLHQGDNRYNQQTECKDTTQCFKSNHITTSPARQAVFIPSCAVQNSVTMLRYIFYHIPPHSFIYFWDYLSSYVNMYYHSL